MSLFDQLLAKSLPLVPRALVGRFASPYVAGETSDSALLLVRGLNQKGLCATLDVLGEDITRRDEAAAAAASYVKLLDAISDANVDANVSLKLSQFGLKLDRKVCLDNLRAVLVKARARERFVRIDMEDSGLTDATLEIFEEIREEFPRVGVVLQAMLKRTPGDARALAASGASVRLCKGIYVEPATIAHTDREAIRRAYVEILAILLDGKGHVGIATHDEVLVEAAYGMVEQRRLVGATRHEFQMLLGVRPTLRDAIAAKGHRVRIYVPFGDQWYAYSVRRLRENPAIAGHVVRALLRGNR